MTSNNQLTEAEQRLEGAIGSWVQSLEEFENLVEGMNKKQLRRAIKAAYAHPLEHERITLNSGDEEKLLKFFGQRDADKLNAALAHMEIEGQKIRDELESEGTTAKEVLGETKEEI